MQNNIQNIINTAFGLVQSLRDIVIAGPENGSKDFTYSAVMPYANYSPWLADAAFQAVFQQIKTHTLVDQYRLYELWQLCEQLQHIAGDVLEIGVWKGGSAVLLANKFASLNVALTVFAADTFKGVVKVTNEDPSYKGGEHHETSEQLVQELANKVNHQPLNILNGIFPEDTAYLVDKNQFRLIHIDVDIYQSAKDVFEWAWPRLSIGGMVVFDDYGFSTCQGITKLVNNYQNSPDKIVIHNLNGHALIIKLR
jgi:O-methyltransferase